MSELRLVHSVPPLPPGCDEHCDIDTGWHGHRCTLRTYLHEDDGVEDPDALLDLVAEYAGLVTDWLIFERPVRRHAKDETAGQTVGEDP